MASVGQDKGWLRLDFRYRRVRCREYLNLPDTRDARFEANRIKRRLEAEIRAGTFNYADFFPNSPRAERFGVRPQRQRRTVRCWAKLPARAHLVVR